MPFFSVVIPVYNKEPHIARSVSSVISQTFTDFELIIVCDPSTDNSNIEVSKFKDPRIKVFHRDEPGPGGYAARNLGIKVAKAEWVAFLDADDEWYPEHLEKMAALSKQFPQAKVMGCGSETVDPDVSRERLYDNYFKKNKDCGSHYLSFFDYINSEVNGMRPLNGITACITKNILERSGAFPASKANRGGDVDTWLRCIEMAGGIAWGSHVSAVYYRNSVNMVTKTHLSLAKNERDTVKKLLNKHSGETAKLLKRFSNRRTISAWVQNCKIKNQKNFMLLGRIYFEVDTIQNAGWVILTMMPQAVFNNLSKAKRLINFKARLRIIRSR